MQICNAGTADISAISNLALTCCQRFIFPGTSIDGINYLKELYSERSLRDLFRAGNLFLIALHADELVGALAMLEKRQHVFLMFVSEQYHRQGIGRALVQHVVDHSLAKSSISLNSSLGAIEFYQNLGFTASGPLGHKAGLDFLPMQLAEGSPCNIRNGH